MKKFMLRVMPIVLVAMVVLAGTVSAAVDIYNPTGSVGRVDDVANNVWGTVLTVLRVCAVAAIVFAGVKYMFASAENKADIKNGMIGLVVGAILVFGASIVVQLIMDAANQAI